MYFKEHILETFIVELMKSGSKSHGKNLIKNIIAQVNMIVVLINMVFNAEHRSNFGKIKVGLIK